MRFKTVNKRKILEMEALNISDSGLTEIPKEIGCLINLKEFWLNGNQIEIITKCKRLYRLKIKNELPENVSDRCCDYKLLEEKCKEYSKVTN